MFKYRFFEFFKKEVKLLTIQFDNSKFLIGGFFTESSLINIYSKIDKKLSSNKDDLKEIDWSLFPYIFKNDIKLLKEIFSDLKVIIIPNFESIISYIHIFKLISENQQTFNIPTLDNILIYSTEPIIQFAQSYLDEFYSSFNSLLINYARNYSTKNLIYITNNDISKFLNKIIPLNYNEKINYLVPLNSNSNNLITTISPLEKYLHFELCSNGYELGSSNILFHFYNKKILIITKSSLFQTRYPKKFDLITTINIDYLLIFPDAINESKEPKHEYENNFQLFLENLYKITKKGFKGIHGFPYVLILSDIFFMMELCDVFRFKIIKTMKIIYFSSSVEAILKYSNISLGFINEKLVDKIYDFKLPFSYNELTKDNSFVIYNDVIQFKEEFIKYNNTNVKTNNIDNNSFNKSSAYNLLHQQIPFCFIANKFSIFSKDSQNTIDFFMNNYDPKNDKIIVISNNSSTSSNTFNGIVEKINKIHHNANVKQINTDIFIFDYRLNNKQYLDIITQLNPKNILDNQSKDKYIEINLNSSNLVYTNCYLLSKEPKGILSKINNNQVLNINITNEQLRYNITLDNNENKNKKLRKKKNNEENDEDNEEVANVDHTEEILGKYLEINEMEMTEFLRKEDCIEMTILNKIKGTMTEVKIFNYLKESDEFNIIIDNRKSKSSKKMSEDDFGNNMIIEVEGDDKDKNTISENDNEKLPYIEINSDDCDDSLFLNTLLNNIFI